MMALKTGNQWWSLNLDPAHYLNYFSPNKPYISDKFDQAVPIDNVAPCEADYAHDIVSVLFETLQHIKV